MVTELVKVFSSQRAIQHAAATTLFLLALLASLRLGSGAFSTPDEHVYHRSLSSLTLLTSGNVTKAADDIINYKSRPASVIIYWIPTTAQLIALKVFDLKLGTPPSDTIAQLFKLFLTILIGWQLFRIFRIYLPLDLSLVGVAIYFGHTVSTVHLTRLLPYEPSLLFGLISLRLILENNKSKWSNAKSGVSAGIALACYTGYYFFAPALAIVLFASDLHSLKTAFINVLIFALSLCSVLFVFELISVLGTSSFLGSSLQHADTIVQGDFNESFTFLFEYVWAIDKISLFTLVLIYTFILLNYSRKNHLQQIKNSISKYTPLFLPALIVWIIHSIMGFVFHKFVFYGRVCYPIITMAIIPLVIYGLVQIQQFKQKYAILYTILALALVSKSVDYIDYSSVASPRDVAYQLGLNSESRRFCTHSPHLDIFWPTYTKPTQCSSTVLGNFCFPHEKGVLETKPPMARAELIFSKPHLLAYEPYLWEGETPQSRQWFRQHLPMVEVYCLDSVEPQ